MSGFGRRAPVAARDVAAAVALGPARGLVATSVAAATALLQPLVANRFDPSRDGRRPRGALAGEIAALIDTTLAANGVWLDARHRRDLVTQFLHGLIASAEQAADPPARAAVPIAARSAAPGAVLGVPNDPVALSEVARAVPLLYPRIMERIDSAAAAKLGRGELARRLAGVVAEVLGEIAMQLNQREQREVVTLLLDDMLGLGPLEPLLADDSINDIMVNGASQIYVERCGRLEATDVTFRDNAHVMAVVTRIVTQIGRRVDEASPLVDARLADGSRVNIIIPPLALDGPSISIRKFSKLSIDLDRMATQDNLSPAMAAVLKIAARCRLNVVISGGTGSGKTTLLNAMSQLIGSDERIVTIEDAAELQLQQPHVVRLETRPANLEGNGEIGMRDLLKNALRMRPDRIILGEIRGGEAIDMLQAMNTGHDGSLGTIHANRPREALTRLENMVAMAGFNLPVAAVRTQIAAAVQLIVQIARMRDGVRRITSITEIAGLEGDVIVLKELFAFVLDGDGTQIEGGQVRGHFESSKLRPHFAPRAAYYGLDQALSEAMAQ
ncbi:MAG: CpaF family protein [Polymorphobacter sp.]